MQQKLPKKFLKQLKAVTKKRPKTVIEHILKHGFITTEELKDTYGYDHPPRAARDVREEGIPLDTFKVKNKQGRKIGAYRFADLTEIRAGRLKGRKTFSKEFKKSLIELGGGRCYVCHTCYHPRYLQIDHRIPYEVAGDEEGGRQLDKYMLLCGSCNRAKSWSCEHCKNWTDVKKEDTCLSCYWASPETYKHIALQLMRRLDVVWTGEQEVLEYERVQDASDREDTPLPEFVKAVLRRALKG